MRHTLLVHGVQIGPHSWDDHKDVKGGMIKHCGEVDQPVAGLLADLKRRGLLEETLVVWSSEMGRTPFVNGTSVSDKTGRDHNGYALCMWMAGGGVKPGFVHGATDDLGVEAIDGKVHIHDLHATMLHLLGLDHERLTYRFQGRDFRLTDVHG